MNQNLFLALFAGLFFGAWPLLMNRSNLSGYLSAAVFVLFSLVVVTPFALYGGLQSLQTADWRFAILAGAVGGIGLLAFSTMLANSSPNQIASLFIIALLTQVMVPIISDLVQNGVPSREKIIGITAAIIAVYFLNKRS